MFLSGSMVGLKHKNTDRLGQGCKGGPVDLHFTINTFLECCLDSLLNEEQLHRVTA